MSPYREWILLTLPVLCRGLETPFNGALVEGGRKGSVPRGHILFKRVGPCLLPCWILAHRIHEFGVEDIPPGRWFMAKLLPRLDDTFICSGPDSNLTRCDACPLQVFGCGITLTDPRQRVAEARVSHASCPPLSPRIFFRRSTQASNSTASF